MNTGLDPNKEVTDYSANELRAAAKVCRTFAAVAATHPDVKQPNGDLWVAHLANSAEFLENIANDWDKLAVEVPS